MLAKRAPARQQACETAGHAAAVESNSHWFSIATGSPFPRVPNSHGAVPVGLTPPNPSPQYRLTFFISHQPQAISSTLPSQTPQGGSVPLLAPSIPQAING